MEITYKNSNANFMLVLLLALVFLLSGCRWQAEKTIVIAGDSTIFDAAGRLDVMLFTRDDYGHVPIHSAAPSLAFAHNDLNAEWFTKRLGAVAEKFDPDIILMGIGYNDSKSAPLTVAQYGEAIDTMLLPLSNSIVIWVIPWGINGETLPHLATIHTAINEAVTRHPNLKLLSYQYWVYAHGHTIQEYTIDGIHLNDAGKDAYSDMVDWFLTTQQ